MATVKVPLNTGLTIGDEIHKEAVIREVTAGDLIDATDDSEKVVLTADGYALLVSNTLAGLHTLRRQIVSVGSHPGPLTLGELRLLSGKDLNLLQDAAEKLDNASLRKAEENGKK